MMRAASPALVVGILLLGAPRYVSADVEEVPAPADLPDTQVARQWLQQDATVQESIANLDAERSAAGMTAASPYEWSLKYSSQRRRYQSLDTRSNEWTTQLERTIRVPGKGTLDRKIGVLGVQIAEAEVGGALQEAARNLLDLWMNWIQAVKSRELIAEQLELANSNLHAVEIRTRTGDAAKFELNVAASDAAELQRRLEDASGDVVKARARLKLRFPGAPDAPPPLAAPARIANAIGYWRERIISRADSLRIAELEVDKAQRAADRARADRIPDPTVSAYAGSEAFSNERLVGVSISVPIPGRYRFRQADKATAHVASALAVRDRQLQMIEVEIAEVYADAVSSYASWQLAEEGAAKTGENARLTQRAYALGEADLQTLLLARQQSLTASQAALSARVAALRAHHRLLIDAHRIWGLSRD